jgi:hypothetical protein
VLGPSTAFAMQLAHVVERAGLGGAAKTGAQLFRVELPAGQVLQNLVPAVGGGFRGMTRAAGSPGFTGHARLFPVGAAAVGTGTAVALGPAIGIVALTVGAEMLAQHQLRAKLDAIDAGVKGISRHLEQQLDANLATADGALRAATAALLDQLEVPEAVGLGAAINELRQVKNLALGWLAKWERVAEALENKGGAVDFDDFRNALGSVAIGGWDSVPSNMVLLYRALALDSRACVVSLAQATVRHPNGTFEHFEGVISESLKANADAQERLANLLWSLTTTRLSAGLSSIKPSNWRQLGSVHSLVARLTRAITAVPDAPSLLTPENRLLVEAVRRPDGQLAILQPRAA